MGKYQELKEQAVEEERNLGSGSIRKLYGHGSNAVRQLLFSKIQNIEHPKQFKAAIPLSHYPRDPKGVFKPTLFVTKRKNEGWQFRTQDTNRTSINLEIAKEKFPKVAKAVEEFGEEWDYSRDDVADIYELVDQELNGEDNND